MYTELSLKIWRLWSDRRAQDLIEYALAAGFLAVTISAFFPSAITPGVSSIYEKVNNIFAQQP